MNAQSPRRVRVFAEPVRPASDPTTLARTVAAMPNPALLVSGPGFTRLGRWSFLAADPIATLAAHGDRIVTTRAGRTRVERRHPLQALRRLIDANRFDVDGADLPFTGGLVGYLGYDLAPWIERLPRRLASDSRLPDLYFGVYDTFVAVDHRTGEARLVAIDTGAGDRPGPAERLADWRRRLRQARPWREPAGSLLAAGAELRSHFSPAGYRAAVARAIEYIAAGDIFQVNLSQRFDAALAASPVDTFLRLCRVNPAPFAAFIELEQGAVVSASPERFLQVRDRWVETRPIKGTRPRSADPAEDRRLADELLDSDKDRAELTMIVDLERNDLGRVCEYGTVHVTEPYVLESYATVHHLVATVVGRLHPRYDLADLIRASFPGGSITGAPKIRAMQIIDELEPSARSLYTGAIGYIGFDGAMDLNIVIRTMLVEAGRVSVQVGGGIVADSEPAAEHQETLDKGHALFGCLRGQ